MSKSSLMLGKWHPWSGTMLFLSDKWTDRKQLKSARWFVQSRDFWWMFDSNEMLRLHLDTVFEHVKNAVKTLKLRFDTVNHRRQRSVHRAVIYRSNFGACVRLLICEYPCRSTEVLHQLTWLVCMASCMPCSSSLQDSSFLFVTLQFYC